MSWVTRVSYKRFKDSGDFPESAKPDGGAGQTDDYGTAFSQSQHNSSTLNRNEGTYPRHGIPVHYPAPLVITQPHA
jgi:hypothetical protein